MVYFCEITRHEHPLHRRCGRIYFSTRWLVDPEKYQDQQGLIILFFGFLWKRKCEQKGPLSRMRSIFASKLIYFSVAQFSSLTIQPPKGLLVWQDFPAGDGRALPLWDSARGVLEQSLFIRLGGLEGWQQTARHRSKETTYLHTSFKNKPV